VFCYRYNWQYGKFYPNCTAPPHGFAKWLKEVKPDVRINTNGDNWGDGCPSGLDVHSVTAIAENHRVTVHTLCMGGDLLSNQTELITQCHCVACFSVSEYVAKRNVRASRSR
jgi:hypothetical protein